MYYPFIESLALTLVDAPIAFFTLLIFCIVLYFVVGLQQSAGQFLCVAVRFSRGSASSLIICAAFFCCSSTL